MTATPLQPLIPEPATTDPDQTAPSLQPTMTLTLRVNGEERSVLVRPYATLLDVLRDDLHLTGTKRGCDLGTCGCCTVHVDGVPVLSCLTLASSARGREITTIEGLAKPESLHPVQAAFCESGGSQCGFCTPGFIMTISAFLETNPSPSTTEIKEAISGNLCRCTGFQGIIEAVQQAAQEMREGTSWRSKDSQQEDAIGAQPPQTRRDPRLEDMNRLTKAHGSAKKDGGGA